MKEAVKKKKRGFNVFDVFVILLVLVLIATAAYKIYESVHANSVKTKSSCTIVFECESEYDSLAKYIKNGEAVYIKSTGELLGYISKGKTNTGETAIYIITEPTQAPTEAATEPNTESEMEGADKNVSEGSAAEDTTEAGTVYNKVKFGGEIKLNGNAEKTGSYYTIEGMNITVGSTIDVYTDDAEFTIVVKQFNDGRKK